MFSTLLAKIRKGRVASVFSGTVLIFEGVDVGSSRPCRRKALELSGTFSPPSESERYVASFDKLGFLPERVFNQ